MGGCKVRQKGLGESRRGGWWKGGDRGCGGRGGAEGKDGAEGGGRYEGEAGEQRESTRRAKRGAQLFERAGRGTGGMLRDD